MKLKYLLFVWVLMGCFSSCGDDNIIRDDYDDFPSKEEEGGEDGEKLPFRVVEAREKAQSTSEWKTYEAQTVDRIHGFEMKQEPSRNKYGAWEIENFATGIGKFKVEKVGNRWWIIDPDGYPMIHMGLAVFRTGNSARQKQAVAEQYGSTANWARSENDKFKKYGFNGTGAWSSVGELKLLQEPMPYTLMINPMSSFNGWLKSQGETGPMGWQGYPNDVVRVFDPRFDSFVQEAMKNLITHKDSKFCLGYFCDNELPWKQEALTLFLTKYPATDAGYQAAKKWMDDRHGEGKWSLNTISQSDLMDFTGFYFEAFVKKITDAAKSVAPNLLFLGCRFNQWGEELINPQIFKVAGKYMDIISINHYKKWQPLQENMSQWTSWSGKPFIITEFYTKGEDADPSLTNTTGAGWNVRTQADRGYFYQNFVIELLKNGGCVGWHWFGYQDNDPEDTTADASNIDSNKGVVTWDLKTYDPLLEQMEILNRNAFHLMRYYDSYE